jgi:hypothetical protein
VPELVWMGTPNVHILPESSCSPPPTEITGGHIVLEHLFTMEKVAALAPVAKQAVIRRTSTELASD